MKLYLDTETYSETPIKHGTYRYVQDCELMVVTWAIDDGPVADIDLTNGDSLDALRPLIEQCDEVIAHNAMFDRLVLSRHFDIPLEKWRCTMVKALAHSLPGGLDKLCEILAVPQDQRKLKIGKDLVRLFCQPRPKTSKIRRATRETHPIEWQQFLDYARADIEAMRAVDKKLPAWNYSGRELELWHLDQHINDRGFAVDLALAEAAVKATAREGERLSREARTLTRGEVESATQRDALLDHIAAEYGILLPDLQGSTLERRLNDPDLPEGFKDLLRIRLQASTTSTSKYKALIRAQTGGRLRGTLQFDGAGRTGRWAGRTFQPQNLSRVPKYLKKQWDFAANAITCDAVDLLYDNPMEVMGSLVRGCIVAPPGCKLVVADLSNIEGRDGAWLGGETWKLQAFRDFDAGVGPDLYKLAYAKAFGIAPEQVDDFMRQIGKVMELACQYQGRTGAFVTFGAAYGIDLEKMALDAWDSIPENALYEAGGFYDWTVKNKRSTMGLSRTAFVVIDAFVNLWRQAHPAITSIWPELEHTAIEAVESPGKTLPCRKFKVRRDGAWLRIGLPSGRALCYPSPQIHDGKLTYMGMNQYSRQWQRLKTYGGKLFENACQAVARDVMAANMPRIEDAGYEIVLTVHDEIINETPDEPRYCAAELSALLAHNPEWAPDIPLAAAGFEAYRYRKD